MRVLLALLVLATSAEAQPVCTRSTGESAAAFFLEPGLVGAGDSVVTARLCLVSKQPIGSYAATLAFDSTRMRTTAVTTTGGMQATNHRVPGIIRLAGAAPNGYQTGLLATITFTRLKGRTLGAISLEISEANLVSGAPVANVLAMGWSVAPGLLGRPAIDSIAPRAGELTHERVTDVVLYGKNFSSRSNVVLFGGVELTGLASEKEGTVIRFAAPTQRQRPDGQPTRFEPGSVQVQVKHSGGTSNAATFLVKGDR